MKKTTSFVLAVSFTASAAAQAPARPHPADPKADIPVRPLESALRGYRPYADPDVGRWREANQEVGRIGGHAGHARGESDPAKAAKPPAAGHGGHK